MTIQYFTVDGRCIIDRSTVGSRYLEMRDGYHPVTNDSMWQDDKRMRPPMICIFEGVTPALGASMAHEDIKVLFTEMTAIRRCHKQPSVSKMWLRALANMFRSILKVGLPTIIFIFIAYFVIMSMIQGY